MLLRLSTRSSKQTCLLKVLTIYILFVKHLCSKIFHKIMTQKRLKGMPHFEKVCERVLLVLTHHTTWFISLGWNSLLLFFQEFVSIIPFMAWFEILTNSREGVTFSSLSLTVIIKQTYLFLKNLNVQFHFVDLDETVLNLIWKLANKTKMCNWCFQFFL